MLGFETKGKWAGAAIGLGLSCAAVGHWALGPSVPNGVAAEGAPAAGSPAGAGAAALDLQAARHLLDRFAFGPRPGDPERVAGLGLEAWLAAELDATPLEDAELGAALEPYRAALAPPSELVEGWLGADALTLGMDGRELNSKLEPYFRDHLANLALTILTRDVSSQRQLLEVMVDFWSNHFNVFAPKGLVRVFAGDYVERVLRPLALGRFEDLLVATARHPAMLVYLDNATNSVQGGLNENYARELLELHTLGVAGGYDQNDVVNVARILTGWSLTRPGQPGTPLEFRFRAGRHDRGAKVVLGQGFPAGGGEGEGLRLLQWLAHRPATAHHLATKLCRRFVADDPPASCTAAAERSYLESGGEIRAVLTAIVHDQSFWSVKTRGRKLKKPLELVASALRICGARPDGTTQLAQTLRRLGEPLLEESVPTGYPETEAEWASSGGLLHRMSFASDLGLGRLEGARVELANLLPDGAVDALLARGNELFLSRGGGEQTLRAIRAELLLQPEPLERRQLAAALFLGSPEFQRQ